MVENTAWLREKGELKQYPRATISENDAIFILAPFYKQAQIL